MRLVRFSLALLFLTGVQIAQAQTWTSQDIGAATLSGSTAGTGSSLTVVSGGSDVWGSADSFRFAYQPLNGDGSITARVVSQSYSGDWAKAGVMLRESLNPGSPNVALFVTPINGVAFQQRTTQGSSTSYAPGTGKAPTWLRLTRAANVITAEISSDGVAWANAGSATVSMAANIFAGVAVTSQNPAVLNTTVFSDAAVTTPWLWSSRDVGAAALPGSDTFSSDAFTVRSSGLDIWGTADAFRFVYQPMNGDGTIVARVASQSYSADWAKAGVMIRESLDAGSPYAGLFVTPVNGALFQQRAARAGASSYSAASGCGPVWLKLTRAGSVISAATSVDGASWTPAGSATVAMSAKAFVGLAVTSQNAAALNTTTLDHVAVAISAASSTSSTSSSPVPPASSPVPSSWNSGDVGAVSAAGSDTFVNGVFTVRSGGSDIWGNADAFHFVYQPLNGDGVIVARVASQEYTSDWAKAGVMIRQSLDAGSPNAALLVTPNNGAAFQQRVTQAGASAYAAAAGKAPVWLRLTRTGTLFVAETSLDGATWHSAGTATVPMSASVLVGLVSTSQNAAALNTTSFDSVSVTAIAGSTSTSTSSTTTTSSSSSTSSTSTGSSTGGSSSGVSTASTANVIGEADFSASTSAFQIPTTLTQYAPAAIQGAQSGMTVRYINNVRYFIVLLHSGNVIEFPDPGFSASAASYPRVAAGNITTYRTPFAPLFDATGRCGIDDGESCSIKGIYWDERDQRLYASYGDAYGPGAQSAMPSLTAVSLNHQTATSTLIGHWTVGSAGYKSVQTGVARLSDAWANAHTGGKTLVAGWGGNYSLMNSGGVSMGIAAQAFAPPSPGTGTIATQTLVSYPFAACTDSSHTRMARPMLEPALDQRFDGCRNDETTWGDLFNGCVFIDTGAKQGFLCASEFAKGYTGYAYSTEVGVGAEHRWVIFNPADLASGAAGIQPVANFARQFPDENYNDFPYKVSNMPITSATRSGGVLTFTVPNHGLLPGYMNFINVAGVSASEYNGTFSVYVKDANTLQACANGGSGVVPPTGVDGCSPTSYAPYSATVTGATATRLWVDTTGYHQQMTLSYDEKTQDVFVLMSLPVNYPGTNTFTVYKFHVQ